MKPRHVALGGLLLSGILGACAMTVSKPVVVKRTTSVAPAKPRVVEPVHPARFVLVESVGVSYDESGEGSPVRAPDPALVAGKRVLVEGGRIMGAEGAPESLTGFRSLPARLGGGFVFWSDDNSYHAPTFLGKLTPFAKIGARGGVRPWYDTFVLRSDIGALEVTPGSFTVRRTELARFSEMLSLDGKIGIRTDAVGHMEASGDGGKTYREVLIEDVKRWSGPAPGPGNTIAFRRDTINDWSNGRPGRNSVETRIIGPEGKLIPFDPKTKDPQRLEAPVYGAVYEEPALTRRFAPMELGTAVVAGALVPGDQMILLRESTLRVLSAKTGDLIQDLPLSLGSQEFGHCQPLTLGDDVFLACTHAVGAHLYALRGSPTTVQLEATFPETGGFVAGLGRRFLFAGRCGSTPPTVKDFLGYSSSEETPNTADSSGATPPPPPEAPQPPEDPPEKPAQEAAVCVRLADGTWVEQRIEGLTDRKKAVFLPGDNGQVTVVLFDKPAPDEPAPKTTEGVHVLRVDPVATGFDASQFFEASEPSEPRVRTIARDVWLDEKDGSVHGWSFHKPKETEADPSEGDDAQESPEASVKALANALEVHGGIVGVQIKPDGRVVKHALPAGVESVVVGGPYAVAKGKSEDGPTYYESTDGGQTFVPVSGPVAGDFIEYAGGDLEGCSILGCTLGGGLVRLGWGSDAPAKRESEGNHDKPDDLEALLAKVFDPHSLILPKPRKELHCRLDAKETVVPNGDKPFAATLAMTDETNIGAVVDRKWTALATTPFELKPAFSVPFEQVDADPLRGDAMPLLRAAATSPVGLLLRTKEFRFDLSPGAKRTPDAFSAEVRASVAAELDRETLVFLDARLGEVAVAKGSTARPIIAVSQIPDVNHAQLTLARRAGTGPDVLAVALVQSGTGDIVLGDLDVGRGTVGPLRVAGNLRKLGIGATCGRGPRDHRLVVDEHLPVQFDAGDEGRGGLFGVSLVSIGTEHGCLEASEMRLINGGTLVVRYSGTDAGGHPAMLHEHGTTLRATCRRE